MALNTFGSAIRQQLPYDLFCYAYFPITLTKRVLLNPKRAEDLFARRFWDKWGFLSEELVTFTGQERPLWINMVSGGEVVVASALLERLGAKERPSIFATESFDGYALLRQRFGRERVFFPPWDSLLPVRRVIRRLRPSLFLSVMNVYCPILLRETHRHGATTVLVNGLLNRELAVANPHLRRALAHGFFRELDAIGVQTDADYRAFRELGVPKERLEITGNIYADLRHLRLRPEERLRLRQELGLSQKDKVLMAGSTHPKEGPALLETFRYLRKRVSGSRLILAPRLLYEMPQMMRCLSESGFRVLKRTALFNGEANRKPDYDILVVDTFGELGWLYGAADAVFIGSSLVPINERKGGHNILEPLAHGIPPLFGPHMNLWRPVTAELLNAWPSLEIDSSESLAERTVQVFTGEAPLPEIRHVSARLLEERSGAIDRTAAFLKERAQLA